LKIVPAIVPFVDLHAQHDPCAQEMHQAIDRVISAGDFILGKDVKEFEEEFARYCGTKFAVGVDSGISSLELAMRALGIGAGDEVITVSHTFIATVSSVTFTGATPVLVDIDPATYNIDPAKIEAAITPRTKAILPVHLYGQPVEIEPILAIAGKHKLAVIEDACQAHGAKLNGKRAGSLGEAGCFSFYPAKNLGAFGDGGILTTNNSQLAEKVRMLRNYGQREKYHHVFPAFNRRLDTLQAAVLRIKLKHLDAWNDSRRNAARLYDSLLKDIPGVTIPAVAPQREHAYHLYVIQHPKRDALAAHLNKNGVATGLHYPVPVHLQECYREEPWAKVSLPVTENLASRILSLPMFPGISEAQVRQVCARVAQFPG
jgi:dTDP-4-amino-4,6-dideoxygalactose transaminase